MLQLQITTTLRLLSLNRIAILFSSIWLADLFLPLHKWCCTIYLSFAYNLLCVSFDMNMRGVKEIVDFKSTTCLFILFNFISFQIAMSVCVCACVLRWISFNSLTFNLFIYEVGVCFVLNSNNMLIWTRLVVCVCVFCVRFRARNQQNLGANQCVPNRQTHTRTHCAYFHLLFMCIECFGYFCVQWNCIRYVLEMLFIESTQRNRKEKEKKKCTT